MCPPPKNNRDLNYDYFSYENWCSFTFSTQCNNFDMYDYMGLVFWGFVDIDACCQYSY